MRKMLIALIAVLALMACGQVKDSGVFEVVEQRVTRATFWDHESQLTVFREIEGQRVVKSRNAEAYYHLKVGDVVRVGVWREKGSTYWRFLSWELVVSGDCGGAR